MPEQTLQIIDPKELAKLKAKPENLATGRARTAFNRGGEFDLVTFANGTVVAVVADPKKLSKEQRAEIATAHTTLIERRAALATERPARRKSAAAVAAELAAPAAPQPTE